MFLSKKGGNRGELGGVFGLNVPLAVLIDQKFHVDAPKIKDLPPENRSTFGQKKGQNWLKCAVSMMRILRARTCRRAGGLILSSFYPNQNFMGVFGLGGLNYNIFELHIGRPFQGYPTRPYLAQSAKYPNRAKYCQITPKIVI